MGVRGAHCGLVQPVERARHYGMGMYVLVCAHNYTRAGYWVC